MSRYILAAIAVILAAAPVPSFAAPPLVIHSRIQNFPGQQLCQVDRAERRYREFCAPPSYHPYGITGYQPFGTYRPLRRVRPYVLAPNAKIIPVQ